MGLLSNRVLYLPIGRIWNAHMRSMMSISKEMKQYVLSANQVSERRRRRAVGASDYCDKILAAYRRAAEKKAMQCKLTLIIILLQQITVNIRNNVMVNNDAIYMANL